MLPENISTDIYKQDAKTVLKPFLFHSQTHIENSKEMIKTVKVAPISKTTVCPLASRVRRMIRNMNLPDFPAVYSCEPPAPVIGHAKNLGSIITVTGAFGLMLANYVIGEIIHDN